MAAVVMDTYYPFDAGAGAAAAEADWRTMATNWRGTGVLRGSGGNPLNPTIVAGNVRINLGAVWIFGHYAANTGTTDLTPAAPHATLDRIDRAVARLDATDNNVELDLLTGTPAGSPTVPALTNALPIWEISLGHILVKSVAGGSTLTATDMRDWSKEHTEHTIGEVTGFAGAVLPGHLLLCNGQAVSKITYYGLYAQLASGVLYGQTTTTFNLPDLRGRTIFGLDNMGGVTDAGRLTTANTLGTAGGTETVTLTTASMPSHTHTQAPHNHQLFLAVPAGGSGALAVNTAVTGTNSYLFSGHEVAVNLPTGGDGAHNNMPPFLTLGWVIQAF